MRISRKINTNEYYVGLIIISIAVGFVSREITTGFIILGVGVMIASFLD